MGIFSDLLRKMTDFLSDADKSAPPKTKPGIQALATKRLKALQEHLELVQAQLRLAAQSRRELQRMVAEVQAVEAIGKQALGDGQIQKAEAAMARYAAMQETIRQMTTQAQAADRQAAAVAESFRAEAEAAQRAAAEAKALSQLENVIELQKKHQALTQTQSAAAEAFETAREKLLLSASVQAASLRLQSDMEALDRELEASLQNDRAAAVGRRWQKELAGTEEKKIDPLDPEEDPADSAIRYLEGPSLGGPIDTGPKK
ncbi:MAG: hypothetical protein HZB87_12575 [Desulfatitalea sp.]|nr:hypothetical protein [Desulfatitalea sp.]